MAAVTSPTASKRREYPLRRPLQRAPAHPGALMREILEEHTKMTIAEAARRMKVSRPALYAVLNGTAAMTADMALRFARLTGGTPELYLNMQTGHDLEAAQQRLQEELAGIEPRLQYHPADETSAQRGRSQGVRDYPVKNFQARPTSGSVSLRHRRGARVLADAPDAPVAPRGRSTRSRSTRD